MPLGDNWPAVLRTLHNPIQEKNGDNVVTSNLLSGFCLDEWYGKTTVTGNTNGNRFAYTGREDDGTRLYYYRARYYHPEMVRFISEAPIGLNGGVNLYGYVGGDPLSWTDPLGLVRFYGNWCGPNWTGGYERPWDQLTPQDKSSVLPSIDTTDSCCAAHDKCHAKAREMAPCSKTDQEALLKQCDRALSSCIWNNTPY